MSCSISASTRCPGASSSATSPSSATIGARRVVWGVEGAGEKAGDEFFGELGAERSAKLRAISMDMGPGYAKSARKTGHAPQATICIDSYHVVALATKALDEVRRDYWNQLRTLGDQQAAKRFKDARWSLLEEPRGPHHQTSRHAPQAQTRRRRRLARLHPQGGPQERSSPPASNLEDVTVLIDRFIKPRHPQPPRSPFVRLAQTITKHRDGILAADPPRHHPGPHRGTEQQGTPHHPPRLRLPLSQGRPRPRPTHLRTQ